MLGGVLATMREAVVIVDSQMQVALYNDTAAHIFKLPPANAGKAPAARTGSEATTSDHTIRLADEISGRAPAEPPIQSPGGAESTRVYRLTDATRDPAINRAFNLVLQERIPVELKIEMADRENHSFQLNIAPLGRELALGVFFDITQLERLERVRREFFANLSH